MNNWPAGVRQTRRKPDGLNEQLITLRSPEEVARWKAIIGDTSEHVAAVPAVHWPSDMCLVINGHRLTFEATEERDQWSLTFPRAIVTNLPLKEMAGDGKTYDKQSAYLANTSSTHEAYAVFYPTEKGALLVLGSRPIRGITANPTPDGAAPVDLQSMTAAELRTYAATKGVTKLSVTEPKAILIERIHAKLAESAKAEAA